MDVTIGQSRVQDLVCQSRLKRGNMSAFLRLFVSALPLFVFGMNLWYEPCKF